jgi:hypothetical protein
MVEASKNPGGWVYEIIGDYGEDDQIPPSSVKCAWKVDDSGKLTGECIKNEDYIQPR